ncbi:MAG TPA: sensor domain-containing diguanylate cyclase [Oxalicibacterium sp.]|nr:sensor domain-containing diguanylate cyclase [Oxalicibacterium sp.]
MIHDFTSATKACLEFLRQQFGFDLWMVTRTEGDDWIVLAVEDRHYGVKAGSVFRWSDSFCSRMVKGLGPRVAPCVDEVPAYVEAPIGQALPIGAYVGVPLMRKDGSLFGTLCAIDPSPQSGQIRQDQQLIELMADMLSSLLHAELAMADVTRRAERAESEALHDTLTSLYNRRGWERLLEQEEGRCRRYGHRACVISIDLDELKIVNDTSGHAAGDALLRKTAGVMLDTLRANDIAARIGGDEFSVLGVECDLAAAETLVQRLRQNLAAADIRCSIGWAPRNPEKGLSAACLEADRKMYAEKKGKQGAGRPE